MFHKRVVYSSTDYTDCTDWEISTDCLTDWKNNISESVLFDFICVICVICGFIILGNAYLPGEYSVTPSGTPDTT